MALTEEQLKARKGRITSSKISAILGVNPYKSPLRAALELRGDLDEPEVNSKATERGNRLEELILDYPCETYGYTRKPAPFIVHPEHPHLGDSADALYFVGDSLEAVGEGKSAALVPSRDYGEEETDDVADHTYVQSCWHLLHRPEAQRCVAPVLVGGYTFEFRNYVIERDNEFIGYMLDEALRFYRDHVVGDTLPAPDHRDDPTLRELYPRATQGALAPSMDIVAAAIEKESWRQRKVACEERESAARNRLAKFLAEHESCAVEGWGTITYKAVVLTKPVVDYPAIIKEADVDPEIIKRHSRAPAPRKRGIRVYPKKVVSAGLREHANEWLERKERED